MLGDGIDNDLTIASHRIHLNLLRILNEPTHHHGMVLTDIRSQFQEPLQLLAVGAHVHGSTREHIRRAHQYGEAHLFDELIDIVHDTIDVRLHQLVDHHLRLSVVSC